MWTYVPQAALTTYVQCLGEGFQSTITLPLQSYPKSKSREKRRIIGAPVGLRQEKRKDEGKQGFSLDKP